MRVAVAVTVMCLSVVSLSVADDAKAVIRKTTDIPAQGLESALSSVAKEYGFQVLYRTEVVEDLQTQGASGSLTVAEALDHILSGTGLTYHYVDGKTITVVSKVTASSIAATAATANEGDSNKEAAPFWDRFRLAQVDQGQTSDAGSVESQRKPGSGGSLEEIVVTAQRRSERLLDVPISIVALGADELQDRKITSLDDLQFAVPGMAVSSDGFANRIELRGVSNAIGVAPLVGVYIDEADVTNSSGTQINPNTYDLERVEVLRGPQGTLYGEGSAGGTVRFITKSPTLDRFGMTASVTSLFTQDGSPGERINTAVNVPLIDHELGIRIVATYDREGGWIDQPAAGLKDINGQDLTNVRIKGLWQPSAQFSASFMAELYRNDRSTGAFEDAGGNFTQAFNLTTTPKVSEDHDLYNLTLTYELPAVRILNTTSYFRGEFAAKDTGYISLGGPPGTPPYDFLYPYQLDDDHAWVEELRLSSIGSGSWQWTVGGIYRHYRSFFDQPTSYFGSLGPPGTALPAPYGVSLSDTLFKSWSVFGDINYTLWERFTLGFGLRSFHESQDYVQVQDYGSGPIQIDQTGRFHSVDPRVYAQYKLSRDIDIYASAAKGFRSGGFNSSPTQPTFAPEDVRTYELGTKMSLLGGRLHAEAAIFYTDYKDYVVNGIANLTDQFAANINAGNARLKGVDWDFAWRPSDQWSFGVNGEYLDTRFTKINATSTFYDVGDPLDFVPKYQMTLSTERDFTWDGKQLSMRLDYTRRGRETYRVRSLGPWFYGESDVINLLGYNVNLRWSPSLSFNLFAQNLLNDRGLIVPSSATPVRSRPRNYGVGFEVSF